MKKIIDLTIAIVIVATAVMAAFLPYKIGMSTIRQVEQEKSVTLCSSSSADYQLNVLYEETTLGKTHYITADVYGDRVLEMNGVHSFDELSKKTTIVVPWCDN